MSRNEIIWIDGIPCIILDDLDERFEQGVKKVFNLMDDWYGRIIKGLKDMEREKKD